MSSLKFSILAPRDQFSSGGAIVLYKLNEVLNQLGHESEILKIGDVIGLDNKKDRILIGSESIIIKETYYEHFKAVVVWLLNTPGAAVNSTEYSWTGKELIYRFTDAFTCSYPDRIRGNLTIFDYNLDTFKNLNLERNIKSSHMVYKGASYFSNFEQHPVNSVPIDEYRQKLDVMSKIFNKSAFFFSYDNNTYLSVAAALCGCISIVIPNSNMTQEEWSSKSESLKYGVAYGVENLNHAIQTQSAVAAHLQQLEQTNLKTVLNFIEDCKNI